MVIQVDPAEATLPLAEARDVVAARTQGADYPDAHAVAVASCAAEVAAALELDDVELEVVRAGALLHDVGKLAVDRRVLDKAGPLTESERAHVNTHSAEGERLVAGLVDRRIAQVVRLHHERWDGKGYPDGLAGDEIPVAARVVAVADAFLAMQEDRPYRRALALDDALQELARGSGSQFDPRCVSALCSVADRGPR